MHEKMHETAGDVMSPGGFCRIFAQAFTKRLFSGTEIGQGKQAIPLRESAVSRKSKMMNEVIYG